MAHLQRVAFAENALSKSCGVINFTLPSMLPDKLSTDVYKKQQWVPFKTKSKYIQ